MNGLATTKTFLQKENDQHNDIGYIYILLHESGHNVKIGETRVSPASRERDYVNTYQLKGFRLARTFEVPSTERKRIEGHTHQILRQYQLSGLAGAREIFACGINQAVNAIETAISKNIATMRMRAEQAEKRRVAAQKRAKEQEKQKAAAILQKKAEEAWSRSKENKDWERKLESFEEKYPIKEKVGVKFEPKRAQFTEGVWVFLYFTFWLPIGALANIQTWGLPVLVAYVLWMFYLGGAFDRSHCKITNENHARLNKTLQNEFSADKEKFMNSWKNTEVLQH